MVIENFTSQPVDSANLLIFSVTVVKEVKKSYENEPPDVKDIVNKLTFLKLNKAYLNL